MLLCVVAAGGFLAVLRREEADLVSELESEVMYHEHDEPRICDCRLARGIQMAALHAGCALMLSNA